MSRKIYSNFKIGIHFLHILPDGAGAKRAEARPNFAFFWKSFLQAKIFLPKGAVLHSGHGSVRMDLPGFSGLLFIP